MEEEDMLVITLKSLSSSYANFIETLNIIVVVSVTSEDILLYIIIVFLLYLRPRCFSSVQGCHCYAWSCEIIKVNPPL